MPGSRAMLRVVVALAILLNITVLGGSTIQQVAATGTRFTCIAIARSDMAS